MNRSYFAGAFAIVSSEKKENMDFFYEKIQEEVKKYEDRLDLSAFKECNIIADAHESHKNSVESFASSLDFDANVFMRYFHVCKATVPDLLDTTIRSGRIRNGLVAIQNQVSPLLITPPKQ